MNFFLFLFSRLGFEFWVGRGEEEGGEKRWKQREEEKGRKWGGMGRKKGGMDGGGRE